MSADGDPRIDEILLAIKKDRRDSGSWRLMQLILPVVLTSSLGLLVWQVQKNIELGMTEQGARLNAELSFAQELQKLRLQAYSKILSTIVNLEALLKQARLDGSKLGDAQKLTRIFSDASQEYRLIISSETEDTLNELWRAAVMAVGTKQVEVAHIKDLEDRVRGLEELMKRELGIDELSVERITGESGP